MLNQFFKTVAAGVVAAGSIAVTPEASDAAYVYGCTKDRKAVVINFPVTFSKKEYKSVQAAFVSMAARMDSDDYLNLKRDRVKGPEAFNKLLAKSGVQISDKHRSQIGQSMLVSKRPSEVRKRCGL